MSVLFYLQVVLITLCIISATSGIKTYPEEPKDKREAGGTYLPPGGSSHNYPLASGGQDEASAISIGAGYSVGGAKPSYSYVGQGQGSGASYQLQSEGLPASGHATIQLAPITLQEGQGHGLVSNDLSQLMSQLSHGLNSGAIAIPQGGHEGLYQFVGQSSHGGQEASLPQLSYGSPNLQQYSLSEQNQGGAPAYAFGSKGLGSLSSATGPVLFSQAEGANHGSHSFAAPSGGHSYEGAGLAHGGSGISFAGLSLGGSGHSFGGSGQGLGGSGYSLSGSVPSLHSLSGSGHSLGGSGNSLGGSAYSLGSAGAGHSFGGSLKGYNGNYAAPGKSSFKPSAFLGASVQGDSGHGFSGLSASSISNYQPSSGHGPSLISGNHGASFGSLSGYNGGSSKLAHSYLPPKSEGFGSIESIASAFSASGQLSSPPRTTYGIPSASHSASNVHAAAVPSPAYYVSSAKHSSPSFGSGSSFRGPLASHSSFSSHSSSPKYSFGGHSNSRYVPSHDAQGSYSENTYNTIKYSEELKPRHN